MKNALKDAAQLDDEMLACVAYTSYVKAVGGKSYNGDPLPTWEVMVKDPAKVNLVKAWRASSQAVAKKVIECTPRMVKHILAESGIGPTDLVALAGKSPTRYPSTNPPSRLRALSKPTRCCGTRVLLLGTGIYSCACGKHREPINARPAA